MLHTHQEEEDARWMRRALELARNAWGRVSPNPMVGAVLVKDGAVVAEGWHRKAGQPHAEAEALRACGGAAPPGATLYVTLEPCSTHGRTPPCAEMLVQAGVARVVAGCVDPNPAHAGRGLELLRRAGVEVRCGVERKACERLNEAFFTWITRRRPFVLLKLACTLDGRIATASGDSKWITGVQARARAMELRRWADAVMIGGGTARLDRPSLTVRPDGGSSPEAGWSQPRRLVATRSLSPSELAGLLGEGPAPEAVACATPAEWRALLARLGAESVGALLVEGGGELAASLLAADAVDRVEFHMAPGILGGRGSRPAVGGEDPPALSRMLRLHDVETERLGEDIKITGLTRPEPPWHPCPEPEEPSGRLLTR